MKLPNADHAIIDRTKLIDYLLSPTHPTGRFKAAWFSQFGYNQTNWQQFELDLREHHLGSEATELESSEYGTKYRIGANFTSPNGKQVALISIWIVLTGESQPRLVTAYPGDE